MPASTKPAASNRFSKHATHYRFDKSKQLHPIEDVLPTEDATARMLMYTHMQGCMHSKSLSAPISSSWLFTFRCSVLLSHIEGHVIVQLLAASRDAQPSRCKTVGDTLIHPSSSHRKLRLAINYVKTFPLHVLLGIFFHRT